MTCVERAAALGRRSGAGPTPTWESGSCGAPGTCATTPSSGVCTRCMKPVACDCLLAGHRTNLGLVKTVSYESNVRQAVLLLGGREALACALSLKLMSCTYFLASKGVAQDAYSLYVTRLGQPSQCVFSGPGVSVCQQLLSSHSLLKAARPGNISLGLAGYAAVGCLQLLSCACNTAPLLCRGRAGNAPVGLPGAALLRMPGHVRGRARHWAQPAGPGSAGGRAARAAGAHAAARRAGGRRGAAAGLGRRDRGCIHGGHYWGGLCLVLCGVKWLLLR